MGLLLLTLGDALPSESVLALEVFCLLLGVASAEGDEGDKGDDSHYYDDNVVADLLEI